MYIVCNKLFLPRRLHSASILHRSAVYGNNIFFQRVVPAYLHIHCISRMPESNAEAVVFTSILTAVLLKHTSVNGNKSTPTYLALLSRNRLLFLFELLALYPISVLNGACLLREPIISI